VLARLWNRGARQPDTRPAVTYEPDFVAFVQARRRISADHAAQLVARSQQQFDGGWGGPAYRDFTSRALELLRPLHDDSSEELIGTYQVHAPFDFLRMLSYPIPAAAELRDITDSLAALERVDIVDYGCGLAQRSIALAGALKALGKDVHITLVDISRPLFVEFLAFLCERRGLASTFVEVQAGALFPSLPRHDFCDLVNVLEHLAEPCRALESIDRSLRDGGLLLAAVEDQADEIMHVSPNLGAVRARLAELRYRRHRDLFDATLFEKQPRG
jgi:SAM-dependent methyltransferase